MNKQAPKSKNWIRYYDDRNILDEITDESVDLILDNTYAMKFSQASVKGNSKTSQSRLIRFKLRQSKSSPT
jgi:hypothetical protein